jgi:phenylacetate-CoA ligase
MFKLSILDLGKGTNINRWHKLYGSALKWNRKDVIDYQNMRLRKLIEYVYNNVPYYRKIFLSNNLKPEQIKSAEDLVLIPVLDRETIRREQEDLLDRTNSNKKRKGSSSGTTGIPIDYYYNNDGLSAGIASGYILWGMSGWKPGQRNVHIWGNASSISRWSTPGSRIKNLWMNQLNIPSTLLNDPANYEMLAKKIIDFDPVSIDGYSSAIFTLSQYFQKKGLKIKSLKQVFTTAENLEQYQKEQIEKILASTSDLYGCGELLGIATRPIDESKYYLFEPHIIAEVSESGIKGMQDLIVTDLNNYLMPFIRYKLGDMIDNIYPPDAGSRYPFSSFNKIMGRSSEIIRLPNGMLFHPVNIFGGTLFREFPGITKHKVVWNGKSILFLFESEIITDQIRLEQMLEDLMRHYGVPFKTEFTKKILPNASGKFKYVELTDTRTDQR